MIVRTVLGDIAPGRLGATYLHEHLIIDSPLVADRFPHIHLPSVDEAVAEVAMCRAAGVEAMVDAMPCASGRDVVRLAQVSEATGVHVVAATGLHTGKYYVGHPWAAPVAPEALAERFIADIEQGVDRHDYAGPVVERTGHRAGIVKVATTGPVIARRERALFEAAALTYRRTGVPILTHCEDGAGALEQVALLEDLGVPLSRVVLSHTDKVADAGFHKELLGSGVNLEYDQALRQADHEDPLTARLLAEMIGAGFAGQLMLGTDGARRTLWSALGGSPGLAWLGTGFMSVLESHGIDAATRRQLLVGNPARFLAFEPAP